MPMRRPTIKDIANKYQHGLVAEYDKIRMETQMKNVLPNAWQHVPPCVLPRRS